MPRIARLAPGGLVYHVLNHANGRLRLFKTEQDFLAFERVLLLAHQRLPVRILDWCLMSNHWHLVLWGKEVNKRANNGSRPFSFFNRRTQLGDRELRMAI